MLFIIRSCGSVPALLLEVEPAEVQGFRYAHHVLPPAHLPPPPDAVVTEGGFELLVLEHPTGWVYPRRTRTAELEVAANFSAEEAEVDLTPEEGWTGATTEPSNLAGAGPSAKPVARLGPWPAIVWRRPG